MSLADDEAIELEEPIAAIVKDVSSDSSDKYEPNNDKPDKEGKIEEEEALDETSGSEVKRSKPKKKLKKAGHGQLRMAIQSSQRKDLPQPGEQMTSKHKASVREEP